MTIDLEKVVTIKFKNCEINGNNLVNKTIRNLFVELSSMRLNLILNGGNNLRVINVEENMDYEIGMTMFERENPLISFVIRRYHYKFITSIIGKILSKEKDNFELELVDVNISPYE